MEFVHTSQFTTPVAEEYAQELIEFAGDNFRGGAVYFTCGGSESVETAMKLRAISGGNRTRQTPPGFEPDAKLSCPLSGRFQFQAQAAAGDLFAHGARVRACGIPYCYRCITTAPMAAGTADRNMRLSWRMPFCSANGEAAAFIFEPVSGATAWARSTAAWVSAKIAEVCRARRPA